MTPLLRLLLLAFLLLLPLDGRAAESYTFDPAEIEKKPLSFGGYVEFRPVLSGMDRDSALYKLQYYAQERGATLEEYNARLQLEGRYEKGPARLYVRTNTDLRHSSFTGGTERTALFEGYGALKPSDSWKFEIGKKNLKWGKGYAWNPVNFLDRAKDPADPDQTLEGNVMATLDYIRSFAGPLKTLSFTPILFPVYDHVNDSFGLNNRLNLAGRLYLLLYDTDIDLIYVAHGSRTARMGLDFSRNISTNLEIHGELAHIQDNQKQVLEPTGAVRLETENATSGLIGIRHLSAFDLTTIIEYYHNGAGFKADTMKNYFRQIHQGAEQYRTTGNNRLLAAAQSLAAAGYGRSNPREDYLYLRLSQKEPWNILYFSSSLTTMVNLNDQSYSITPELQYTGITNLDLRLRFGWQGGGRETEFGEKANRYRLELRAGYYF